MRAAAGPAGRAGHLRPPCTVDRPAHMHGAITLLVLGGCGRIPPISRPLASLPAAQMLRRRPPRCPPGLIVRAAARSSLSPDDIPSLPDIAASDQKDAAVVRTLGIMLLTGFVAYETLPFIVASLDVLSDGLVGKDTASLAVTGVFMVSLSIIFGTLISMTANVLRQRTLSVRDVLYRETACIDALSHTLTKLYMRDTDQLLEASAWRAERMRPGRHCAELSVDGPVTMPPSRPHRRHRCSARCTSTVAASGCRLPRPSPSLRGRRRR